MAEASKFNLGEFITKNFTILAIMAGFIFWYVGCGGKDVMSGGKQNTSDTTRTQVLQPIVVNPAYQPQQNGSTVYIPIPQGSQPVIPASTLAELVEQVKQLSQSREALAKEYYAIRNYSDSIPLKDTAGNRVGVVKLNQTVSENILKSTQPSYQLSFPLTTIVNTIYPKPKSQVFIGVGAETMLNTPKLQQVDVGFMLKNKKDNAFQLSATYDLQSKQAGARAAYYQKLQFKLFGK